ncbi:MAG: hypothetical protein HYX65_10240 [Gemmatimonadetes bacterium]|nr:hypothetical protein [Gemmatimonadota bacterium]
MLWPSPSPRTTRVGVPVATVTVASGPASRITLTPVDALVTGSLLPGASRRRFRTRTDGTNVSMLPP